MVSSKFLFVLILINNICFLGANSRVSFSRPGNMIRIPSVNYSASSKLLNINLSHEILSSNQANSGFSINAESKSGHQYGISFVRPADPSNSFEIGFHFQTNMLVYGDVNIDLGVHDVVLKQGNYSITGLDTRDISLFAVLSSEKTIKDYTISTHWGFGTGKIVQYSQKYQSNPEQKLGAFLGFQFKTPLLKKDGGISLLTEFDGIGLNIGLSIPILKLYQINLGITHFDDLGDFATEDKKPPDFDSLKWNAPAITIGFTMNIPRLYNRNPSSYSMDRGIYSKTDSSILFYNPICTDVVETLRDSIRVGNNIIKNLEDHNIMLLHKEAVLVDSTRNYILQEEVNQSRQNKAMRHLSRSLRFFYDERYRDALSEVNTALDANPNLSIAYGRRGSIYYKLGDLRRATLNWNAALQLDPEFTEIYNMLKASDENRLKAVEISRNLGEN